MNFGTGIRIDATQPQYADAAAWCNENGACIEAIGDGLYEVKAAPALPVPTLEELKAAQIRTLQYAMAAELALGVECTYSGGTVLMDSGEEAARRLADGLTLAQRVEATTIALVDHANAIHAGISIADALSINTQQGVAYLAAYNKYWGLRVEIMAASTAEAVAAITW